MTINSSIQVGAVTISTTGLEFTYVTATDLFTLSGTAGVSIKGIDNFSVTFGHNGNPGLVIQNGSLVSLDVTINSSIQIGAVTFSTTGLEFTYVTATDLFTLSGTVGVSIKGMDNFSVTFGHNGNPGLVIQNGSLVSLDVTLNTTIRVGAVVFSTTGLEFTYVTATNLFTLSGTAGVSIQGIDNFYVTFGHNGNPGLVIQNGSLVSLDLTINSNILIDAVNFSTTGLEFTYVTANDQFTLSGTVGASVVGLGNLTLTFGNGSTPGLVITNGALVSLNMAVNSNIQVAGLTFVVQNLDFAYTTATNTFTLTGSASVSLGFQTFAVMLGDGQGSQGIVVINGSLASLDATISDTFGVDGFSIGQVSLHMTYVAATQTYDFDGMADLTLTASLPGFFSTFLGVEKHPCIWEKSTCTSTTSRGTTPTATPRCPLRSPVSTWASRSLSTAMSASRAFPARSWMRLPMSAKRSSMP